MFFGKSYPGIVGAIVALVAVMFVLHGMLAMRKFPANYHEFREFRRPPKNAAPRGHNSLVGSGGDRLCAFLSGFRSSLPDARAPR